jgi:hypothetical protein
VLLGFRALLNNDLERQTDSAGVAEGLARSAEYRLGGSYSLWRGALVDIGGTCLEKENAIAQTRVLRSDGIVVAGIAWLRSLAQALLGLTKWTELLASPQ